MKHASTECCLIRHALMQLLLSLLERVMQEQAGEIMTYVGAGEGCLSVRSATNDLELFHEDGCFT
ncbi:hypothetical protein N8648_02150 [Verrucomicrobia bacterium]|nr:hypothetical protein [Verrucomicrobiota bacterium]